ncbi:MAG: zinc ribbon domain-containing protein [Candidatus Thermoplasmatota archaeon]|nr:zinc ribbon domain-containing protein [Candidatus Thermoplasmatota archaeon]
MICRNCGQPLTEGAENCPSCGASIKSSITKGISSFVDNAIGEQGMAPVNAGLTRITNSVGIFIILVILFIEAVFFTFAVMHGLPYYLAIVFIGFTVLLLALFLYSNRRIKKINYSNPKEEYSSDLQKAYGKKAITEVMGTNLFGDSPVKLDAGELAVAALSPVYRFQKEFTGPSGVSAEKYTENTIVITNRRVIFITLPLPGQGLLIRGGSQDVWNDILKRKTIKEMASRALETLKSGGSLDHFPNDYWASRELLEEVQYVKVVGPMKFASAGAVGFKVMNSKKLRYSLVDLDGLEVLINELHAVKKHVI